MTTLGYVNVDDRGRIPLAKYGSTRVRIYEVINPGNGYAEGTLLLMPAVLEEK